jgi:hypothetical protein
MDGKSSPSIPSLNLQAFALIGSNPYKKKAFFSSKQFNSQGDWKFQHLKLVKNFLFNKNHVITLYYEEFLRKSNSTAKAISIAILCL